jgi:FKBP-type peptidyl-prolyl cis-trans isomerase FkpA
MRSLIRVRPLFAIALLIGVFACGSSSPVAPDQSNIAYSQTDVTVGTGAEAITGSTATVNYAGWLYSETAADHKGAQFDQNTLSLTLGVTNIIQGFVMGVTGMKVGGVRHVIMPPSLAYGAQGNANAQIPPNAALVFDIQLTNVQ